MSTFKVIFLTTLFNYYKGIPLHALWANFFTIAGMSDGVEIGRECEAAGRARVRSPHMIYTGRSLLLISTWFLYRSREGQLVLNNTGAFEFSLFYSQISNLRSCVILCIGMIGVEIGIRSILEIIFSRKTVIKVELLM